jgi:hypothetical protein
MRKSHFVAEDFIAGLNTVKSGLQWKGVPFSKKEILTCLKNCGLPSNSTFWMAFRASGVVQEVSKGSYMFSSKEPIHVSVLARIYKQYQKLVRTYSDNQKQKKQSEKVEIPEVLEEEPIQENHAKEELDATEQFAIDLLKDLGYLVLAPMGTLYARV